MINGALGRSLSAPISIDINLTNRCNLKCDFCSATPFHHSSRSDELTLAELEMLFNDIEDMGVFVVRLAGGEPFARNDMIEIINLTKDRMFETVILSNGLLLNDSYVDAMQNAGMSSIAISVDGHTDEIHDKMRGQPGALSKLKKKINLLQERGFKYSAMTTITKDNCSHMIDIVDFLDSLGFSSVNFILLNFSGLARFGDKFSTWEQWSNEFVKLTEYLLNNDLNINVSILPPHEDPVPYELLMPLKEIGRLNWLTEVWGIDSDASSSVVDDIGCAAGRTQMTVFEDGDVFGCELMRDSKQLKAGSVRERSLKEIWNGSKVFGQLRTMKKSDLQGHCSACPNACGGGCRASALNITNNLNGSDENCHLARA